MNHEIQPFYPACLWSVSNIISKQAYNSTWNQQDRNNAGKKDVSTTMIYTHVLNKGGMGVKSPLDMLSRDMASQQGLWKISKQLLKKKLDNVHKNN